MIEDGHERRARRFAARRLAALPEPRLHQLEVPVADLAPEEVVDVVGVFVQPEALERFRGERARSLEAREDPPVLELEVLLDLVERADRPVTQAHEREATRVPD